MDKSKKIDFLFLKGIKYSFKWIWRFIFIVIASLMIGFSNAFYNEFRWINDIRNFIHPEQVVEDEDTNT